MKGHLSKVLVLTLFLAGYMRRDDAQEANLAQARVAALSAALTEGTVGRIEILQIPQRILTRAQITPEMLEKQYHSKLIIRDVAGTAYRDKIVDSFKSLRVLPRKDSADIRWGVIFFSRSDARIGAVYFDSSGALGSVDNLPASFKGKFFDWLDSTFSGCFQ